MQRMLRVCTELPPRQACGADSKINTSAPISRAVSAAQSAALPPPITRTSSMRLPGQHMRRARIAQITRKRQGCRTRPHALFCLFQLSNVNLIGQPWKLAGAMRASRIVMGQALRGECHPNQSMSCVPRHLPDRTAFLRQSVKTTRAASAGGDNSSSERLHKMLTRWTCLSVICDK